ncbi:hypothetical protein CC78DRAFT_535519 [Lojkania enalia]|uniref:Uncharacterized protein n=1 Tax=Lojkania enalia TaxID=147567 RepID=A0A9P4MXS8_9PLEO|nr:hypothetical protein CC78DRAFT_535519 [Didymosphaeria enalia]
MEASPVMEAPVVTDQGVWEASLALWVVHTTNLLTIMDTATAQIRLRAGHTLDPPPQHHINNPNTAAPQVHTARTLRLHQVNILKVTKAKASINTTNTEVSMEASNPSLATKLRVNTTTPHLLAKATKINIPHLHNSIIAMVRPGDMETSNPVMVNMPATVDRRTLRLQVSMVARISHMEGAATTNIHTTSTLEAVIHHHLVRTTAAPLHIIKGGTEVRVRAAGRPSLGGSGVSTSCVALEGRLIH